MLPMYMLSHEPSERSGLRVVPATIDVTFLLARERDRIDLRAVVVAELPYRVARPDDGRRHVRERTLEGRHVPQRRVGRLRLRHRHPGQGEAPADVDASCALPFGLRDSRCYFTSQSAVASTTTEPPGVRIAPVTWEEYPG